MMVFAKNEAIKIFKTSSATIPKNSKNLFFLAKFCANIKVFEDFSSWLD